jgi:hypothetical protein
MSIPYPAPPDALSPTPTTEVDAKLAKLSSGKDSWVSTSIERRIALLDELLHGVESVAEAWVDGGARLKGLDPKSPEAGEEWLAGPMVTVRNLRLLREALEAKGAPTPARTTTEIVPGPEGTKERTTQIVARVFPTTLLDKLTLGGITADVFLEPGKPATQGRIYREKSTRGKVCLVLGAGNVSSIAAMDALYKLFVEDEVVLLKMNPVNEHVGPHLEKAFAPLVRDGYFDVIYGGADVGAYAAEHALVDTLHVTGSDRTYDAIVWGETEDERAKSKAQGTPRNQKPFTAELGCVTPVLVVPGPWSESDLRYQARHVASMVAQNASFNCNAAKVLVMARGWLQRESFLEMLHEELARTPRRKAYYPGARDRHRAFLEHYPNARKLGDEAVAEETLPWTVIPDVPSRSGEYALTNEAFCGVLAEVTLDLAEADEESGFSRDSYPDAARFLAKATRFANESCWGTLSCTILIHPSTEEAHREALERAVRELRYGAVAVNCWPGLVYGLVAATWGAFPGHTKEAIVSGAGVVHNTHLFDHPQKTVVRAKWKAFPKLPYFADHKNLAGLGRELTKLEARASFSQLLRVVKEAVRG